MHDYLVKAYAFDGLARVYGAKTTDLVEEARIMHDTWPAATAALGRVLTASVIMGAMYKGDMELSIRIDGNGPINGIVATTNAKGQVRGYVGNPHVHMSTTNDKLAVDAVVGNAGFLHVTKNLKVRDIYTSSSALQTGEIGDDFTYYFASSEQIPSSVGLGVLVNDDNSVFAAGGFILQLLPGAQTKAGLIEEIESRIKTLRPVSDMIHDGYTPEMIINEITKGKHEFVEYLDLEYACDCSKERFAKGLISLGKDELNLMIDENKPIETVCHFCQKKYLFSVDELKSFINDCSLISDKTKL